MDHTTHLKVNEAPLWILTCDCGGLLTVELDVLGVNEKPETDASEMADLGSAELMELFPSQTLAALRASEIHHPEDGHNPSIRRVKIVDFPED